MVLFGTIAVLHVYAVGSVLTPLEQFRAGTSATNVKCNNSMQLVIKAEDDSPACVTPDTANILIERGWAGKVISSSSNNTTSISTSCRDLLQPPLDFTKGNSTLILYMPKNSIGIICVNYFNVVPHEDLVNKSLVLQNNQPVGLSFNIINSSGIFSVPDIVVYASRNNVSAGITSNQVIYTVKTGNYSGLYSTGFSHFQGFVFAVGYNDSSKIPLGNLTWSNSGYYFGPPKFFDANIIGLSGIGFKFIH